MYLYFNKQGVLTTTIPHGEPVRQGSTLNLYVCFDEDYFSSIEELKSFVITTNLILPGSNNRSTDFALPLANFPQDTTEFEKLIDSEVTYDLVPGNSYWIFHFEFPPEVSTVNSGKLIINVKLEKPLITGNLDDKPIIQLIKYMGRAEVYIEKTYGTSGVKSDVSENHYNNLVAQYKELLATVNSDYLKTPKPYTMEYDEENKTLVIWNKDNDQYSRIYLKDDGEIELRTRLDEENENKLTINENGLFFNDDLLVTNSNIEFLIDSIKENTAPLVVVKESDLTTVNYYDLIENNPFYTESTTPIIVFQFNDGTYFISTNVYKNSSSITVRLRAGVSSDNSKVNIEEYDIRLWKNHISNNQIIEYSRDIPTFDSIKENTAPLVVIKESDLTTVDYYSKLKSNGIHESSLPRTVYFITNNNKVLLMTYSDVSSSTGALHFIGIYSYITKENDIKQEVYNLYVRESNASSNITSEEITLTSTVNFSEEINAINEETESIKSKFNQSFKSVELSKNVKNGEYTLTFIDFNDIRSEIKIDTPDEKIIDTTKPPYLEGNNLVLTFVDGSVVEVDMSKLVEYNSFSDTSTISITEDSNHNVTAEIIDGSITRAKLNEKVTGELDGIHQKIEKIQDKMGSVVSMDGTVVSGNTLVCGSSCSFDEETGTLIVGENFSVQGTTLIIK